MLRTADKRLFVGRCVSEVFGKSGANDLYMRYVRSQRPVAYWPMMDASGLPVDVSGNGLDMTAVSGTPTYGNAGPMGEPCIAYPSGAYHERAVVSTVTANLSVEMWINRVGNASSDLVRHGTTSGGLELEYTASSGTLRPNLPGVGTLGTFGTAEASAWCLVVVTRSASQWIGYVFGIGSAAQYAGAPGSASPGTPVGNTRIVGSGATSTAVAHLAVHERVLTPQEVMTRFAIATGAVTKL